MNAPTPITAPEVCGLDLGKLELAALAATPGPWILDDEPYGSMGNIWSQMTPSGSGKPGAEFIATFDPPTALRLISDLRAANTALLREQLRASVLLGALRALIPTNLGDVPASVPDSTVLPCDVTVGEIRAAREAIASVETA